MTYYMIESDDDFLFTEEANIFMEKASAPVKQSFLSRMVEAVKRLFRKVSEFVSRAISKFRGNDIEKRVKSDPKAAKTKVNMKNYDKAVDEGVTALNKIGKATSAKEAKKIAEDYKSKRKKILAVAIPTTLLAAATLIGGGLFLKHKKKLDVVSNAIDSADEVDKKAAQYVKTRGPKAKEVKFNKQTPTTGNLTKDNREPKEYESDVPRRNPSIKQSAKEAEKLGGGWTVEPEADKVEKATITMQISKMTLDDMMANEKETVQLINRAMATNKTHERMMEISGKQIELLSSYERERDRLIGKYRSDKTLSENERKNIEKRIDTLADFITRGRTSRGLTAAVHRGVEYGNKNLDAEEALKARGVPLSVLRSNK